MEIFTNLYNELISFHINEVEYDDSIYKVIRDNITDDLYNPDSGENIRIAIMELLSDSVDFAINKVNYLKNIINELTDFNLGASNNCRAYWRFRELCVIGNFKMEIPREFYKGTLDWSKLNPAAENFHADIKAERAIRFNWENYQAKIIYTQNFIDDIHDAIDNRKAIVSDLEKALQRSKGINWANDKLILERKTKRFERAIDNKLMPNELTLTEWETICKMENIYILDRKVNLETCDNNKSGDSQLSFENELNEKGRKIFNKLKIEFNQSTPAKISRMLLALQDMNCLAMKIDHISKRKLADALVIPFGRNYVGPAINYTLATNVTKPNIDNELEIIRSFLL
jgi:hypothetical protein